MDFTLQEQAVIERAKRDFENYQVTARLRSEHRQRGEPFGYRKLATILDIPEWRARMIMDKFNGKPRRR
jgi:hypothetical protein